MDDMGPQWIELDTPAGVLRCTRPAGTVVYDGLEAIAVLPPDEPAWSCTLAGKPVTLDRARELLASMTEAAER